VFDIIFTNTPRSYTIILILWAYPLGGVGLDDQFNSTLIETKKEDNNLLSSFKQLW